MEEKGIVTMIRGETMIVEFDRSPMCEKCGECERAHEKMRMEMKRSGNVNIGDEVEVEMSEGTLFRASFLAYGVPLILLLIGLYLGKRLSLLLQFAGNSDLYALALGVLLAGAGFLLLRLTEPSRRRKGSYTPRVVKVHKTQTLEGETDKHGK